MGMPVRIDSALYDQAKSHANAERRTIAGQIEFWALIAKAEDRSLATPFEPLSKR